MPAIGPTLDLFKAARAAGIEGFFVTGRHPDQREITRQKLARARHDDFDEVVGDFEFNDEQTKRILDGEDRAELAYQAALATRNYQTPDSVVFGDEEDTDPNRPKKREIDPMSDEALFEGR